MPLANPLGFEPVRAEDFEALLALRIRALRPSLERLGRFDPARSRERMASTFAPEHMQHVLWAGQRVGLVTWRRDGVGLWWLDHLFIEPAHQGQGIGRAVMRWALAQADASGWPAELAVLRQSDAQRYYERWGFHVVAEGELDLRMRREPRAAPLAVARAVWQRTEARDWAGLRALLHANVQARWWTSGEHFVGAEAFVRVQREYPEGWQILVLEVASLTDGRVLSVVRVDHPPEAFYASSVFEVEGGLIVRIDECWGTAEEPAAWRTDGREPGWRRFDTRQDA